MNRLRTRHIAVVLSIAAVAAAGCGSSSSKSKPAAAATTPLTPSTTGTTTTPAGGFTAQLNAICKEGNAQKVTTAAEAAAVGEKFLPRLEALMPPAAQKATYTAFVTNFKAEIAAAKKNDLTTLKALSAKERSLGSKLGAPDCTTG